MNRNSEAQIPYSRPLLGKEEEEAVLKVLRSGWLTTGTQALEFEKEFTRFISDVESAGAGMTPAGADVESAGSDPERAESRPAPVSSVASSSVAVSSAALSSVALSSATAGLHLGLAALELPEGSEILLSPYTFAASANAVLYNRLKPRFVDCAPGGYHLDPDRAEALLASRWRSRKVRGLMSVHFAGYEHRGDDIEDICRNAGIELVEDAAHSFPARQPGGSRRNETQPAMQGGPRPGIQPGIPGGIQGSRGRFGVYSFYANKTITTGEGGMLISRDEALLERVKRLRLHGISREVWSRYTTPGRGWEYDVVLPGFKYNLPDILAAIGRVQLKRADEFLLKRRRIAARYARAFAGRDWCSLPPGAEDLLELGDDSLMETGQAGGGEFTHSWHIYSLRLRLDKLSIGRDEFIARLAEKGIGSSVHFIPLHLMSYYGKSLGLKPGDFPNALESYQSSISLPIFPSLSGEETERIIEEALKIGDTFYRGI
ncbi:DegT/DnrJ/EryC1/StrS family aminotransferase [Salinispira pacifica]|uniref:Putative aminotransferase, DegT family n=1 Tax=Salinispira pacifica TaxID=1307761 RepID=V5WH24_9SPIO|nr:DegT/DnrJ/EryC1/StrS family aminotransferase [Salinispira pacifica]AHC14466.1 Putative aminotransferase, DegT family [Salinispira pacifica]